MAVQMTVQDRKHIAWGKGPRSQQGERSQEEVGDGGWEGNWEPAVPQKTSK